MDSGLHGPAPNRKCRGPPDSMPKVECDTSGFASSSQAALCGVEGAGWYNVSQIEENSPLWPL